MLQTVAENFEDKKNPPKLESRTEICLKKQKTAETVTFQRS